RASRFVMRPQLRSRASPLAVLCREPPECIRENPHNPGMPIGEQNPCRPNGDYQGWEVVIHRGRGSHSWSGWECLVCVIWWHRSPTGAKSCTDRRPVPQNRTQTTRPFISLLVCLVGAPPAPPAIPAPPTPRLPQPPGSALVSHPARFTITTGRE